MRVGPNRPLKTDVIFWAISRGGVDSKDKGVLYRSLFRDSGTFQKVGRGLWGLSAWYGGKRKKAIPSPDEPTSDEEEAEPVKASA